MIFTNENYFSPEASQEYISVSQYKDFCGSLGIPGCEEYALAKLRGDWKEETTTALLASSYVDAHFEGTIDVFKAQHPEIFNKSGDLRSEYSKMQEIINRIERDEYMMKCLSGEKQKIFTGEIFGVQWKGKMDVYIKDICIVDLKVMKSIRETFWKKDSGRLSFVEYYGYDIQAAIYQKLVEINTGKKLPFLIAVASKETFPDIEVIGFNQEDIDLVMGHVFRSMPRVIELKAGKDAPTRCNDCDYCKATKILTKPIHFSELTAK